MLLLKSHFLEQCLSNMKKSLNCAVEGLLASQYIWINKTRTRSESCAWHSLNMAFGSDDFLRIYETQVGVSPLVLSKETDIISTYCIQHKRCAKGTKSLWSLANSSSSIIRTRSVKTSYVTRAPCSLEHFWVFALESDWSPPCSELIGIKPDFLVNAPHRWP